MERDGHTRRERVGSDKNAGKSKRARPRGAHNEGLWFFRSPTENCDSVVYENRVAPLTQLESGFRVGPYFWFLAWMKGLVEIRLTIVQLLLDI